MPLMPGSFDGYQYVEYLRSRWRFAAVACGAALMLSLGISLLRAPKYSATARIVIEPPAGTDLRSLVAVSPIYLESLRTFLLFASSDSLFLEATDHFGLRDSKRPQPIGQLKRSILEVDIPRDTKVLEITATLPDPRKAQALANYLAARLVDLNDGVIRQGDQELIAGAERQLADARARLNDAEAAWMNLVTSQPVEDLMEEITELQQLRAKLEEQIASTDVGIAEQEDREKALMAGARPGELEEARSELRSERAADVALRKQARDLEAAISLKLVLLNKRTALRDEYEERRKAARTLYESVEGRVAEARATAGYRGERLKIIDPAIVPERPSSPKTTLNVLIAVLAAGVLSLLYLTLELNYHIRKAASRSVALYAGRQ